MSRYGEQDTLMEILKCLQQLNIQMEVIGGKLDQVIEQVTYTNIVLEPKQIPVYGQRPVGSEHMKPRP